MSNNELQLNIEQFYIKDIVKEIKKIIKYQMPNSEVSFEAHLRTTKSDASNLMSGDKGRIK